MSAESMSPVQYLTLRGYTGVEKNPHGRNGGDNFACVYSKEGAAKFGMPAGTYISRDVFFVYEYKMDTADFHMKPNGVSTLDNMCYSPGQKPAPGFEISQTGDMLVCRTEGTLIVSDLGGALIDKSYPVLRENIVFDLKYVVIDF